MIFCRLFSIAEAYRVGCDRALTGVVLLTGCGVSINKVLHISRPYSVKMPSKSDENKVQVQLKFAKLSANASTPTRGSALAAGFDLYRLINWDLNKMRMCGCSTNEFRMTSPNRFAIKMRMEWVKCGRLNGYIK